jgi:hypothetical protein
MAKRSRSAVICFGRISPDCSDTKWSYLSAVLSYFVAEVWKCDLVEFLMRCLDMGNTVGIAIKDELFDETDHREGHILKWIEKS